MLPHVVFVHTNRAQLLPARVAVHSLRSRGGGDGAFDVRLLEQDGTELDERRDGQRYRAYGERVWVHTDHLTFHYLRRWVPELLGFRGRAVVVDPDVFAVGSIVPLLESDMGGKALLARHHPRGYANDGLPIYSTGVMLLDCAKLTHWRWHEEIADIFAGRLDYLAPLQLANEPEENIGELDERWNSMDTLTPATRLVHFTRLSTQPWTAGLPLRPDHYDPTLPNPEPSWLQRLFGIRPQRRCLRHPDPAQEKLFFDLLAECLARGVFSEGFLRDELRAGHLRRDVFAMLAASGYRNDRAA